MNELDDLQRLWQGQASDSPLPDPEQTLSGIQEFHRKVRRERRSMMISFTCTFLFLSATFWILHSPFYVIGVFLVFGAMGFLLDMMWKNKLSNNGSRFELSNQDFLNASIDFIQKRRAITTRSMPVYAFLLILGINVGYIDILELMDLPLLGRLGIHIGLSLIMAFLFGVGVKKHLEKFDDKLAPLLANLKKLQQEGAE